MNPRIYPCRHGCIGRETQSGAALTFSLIILLIVTILGLAAMRTSSLEQLMAGNVQEATRALEIADSGIEWMLQNPVTFSNPGATWPANRVYPSSSDPKGTATLQQPLLVQSGVSATQSATPGEQFENHFAQTVQGTTPANAGAELMHGIARKGVDVKDQFRTP